MKEANEIEFKPLRRQIVPKGTQGSCRGSLLRSGGTTSPHRPGPWDRLAAGPVWASAQHPAHGQALWRESQE